MTPTSQNVKVLAVATQDEGKSRFFFIKSAVLPVTHILYLGSESSSLGSLHSQLR